MSFENSMEPYAQLVRSLLPRAASVSLFDSTRQAAVDQRADDEPRPVRAGAAGHRRMSRSRSATASASIARCPTKARPIYSGCATRRRHLAAGGRGGLHAAARRRRRAAVLVRARAPKPALELLRRDLLARADIDQLNESLNARDKDLELLLSVTGSHPSASDGADELQGAARERLEPPQVRARGHRRARQGPRAAAHPEQRLRHAAPGAHAAPAAGHRADAPRAGHHQQARDAGTHRSPFRTASSSCPLRQGSGRTIGVLALFRNDEAPEFVGARRAPRRILVAQRARRASRAATTR